MNAFQVEREEGAAGYMGRTAEYNARNLRFHRGS